jgi:acetoin utilization deacetylase AcuC-like enzyme
MKLIVAGPTGTAQHDGGTFHPEQKARMFSVMDGVRALEFDDEVLYPPTSNAEMSDLSRVHSTAYLAELEAFCAKGGGDIDPGYLCSTRLVECSQTCGGSRTGGHCEFGGAGRGRGLCTGPPARSPR